MDTWILKDQLMRFLQKWYLVFLFIVIGGLIGYLFSYLIPPSYQAVANLYIGIDVERVNEMEYIIPLAKTEPLNLDDYKNWQLKQVADISISEKVLNKTFSSISLLENMGNIGYEDMIKNLELYWYDTGTWQFKTVNRDQEIAKVIAETWLNTAHGVLSELLEYSDEVAELDAEILSINSEIGELKFENTGFEFFLEDISEINDQLSDSDISDQAAEEIIQDASGVLDAQEFTDIDFSFLSDQPINNNSIEDWISWISESQLLVLDKIRSNERYIESLDSEREEFLIDYHKALENSLGLSPNLILEPNISPVDVQIIRPRGMVTFSGGLFGLIVFLIFFLFNIRSRRS